MPDPEAIRALVDRYTSAFSAGDKDGYLACFTDDATLEDPVGAGVHRGKEAIAAFFDSTRELSSSIELRRTGPVRVAGNEAGFPGEARPTMGDAVMVVPVLDTMRVSDDGRISELRAFWDMADLGPAPD